MRSSLFLMTVNLCLSSGGIVRYDDGLFYHPGSYLSHSAARYPYYPLPHLNYQGLQSYPLKTTSPESRRPYSPPAITFLDPLVTPSSQEAEREETEVRPVRPVSPEQEKSAALQRLMAIAGDGWSGGAGGERGDVQEREEEFVCPSPEGHFPSPLVCSVYYQCAQGTPHRRECGPGLAYNSINNTCDWEDNVTCHSKY